jgi:uncharacterized delta-60 repeat protein
VRTWAFLGRASIIDDVRALLLAALVASAGCVRLSTPSSAVDREASRDAWKPDASGRDASDLLRPDLAVSDRVRIDAPAPCIGLLDASFGTAGLAFRAALGVSAGAGVAIAPDGKIVAAGRTASDLALARFDSDGSVDPTFGQSGLALASWSAAPLAGCSGLYLLGLGDVSVLVRYLAGGSLDTTFGASGLYTISVGGGTSNAAARRQPGPAAGRSRPGRRLRGRRRSGGGVRAEAVSRVDV